MKPGVRTTGPLQSVVATTPAPAGVPARASGTTLAIPGEVGRTYLRLHPGLSFEEWERVGVILRDIEGAVQWWVGDWYLYGEASYGEKAAQAKAIGEAAGLTPATVQDAAWVAGRFGFSDRSENVSWTVHRRLAPVEDQGQRNALLRRAAGEGWTVQRAREAVRDLKRVQAPPLPAGKYFVVYADPPWEFRNSGFDQSVASHYATMSMDAICALPVPDLVSDRAVLFLWVPNALLLTDAPAVIQAWGFEYKTDLVWAKDRAPGMGFYVISKHETLLLATKGDDMLPRERPDSWFEAPVTGHSRKPDLTYGIIESMYSGPYIELFARRPRPGWISWGDEVPAGNDGDDPGGAA